MIIPAEIEDFSRFKTDLGKAMKFIAATKDKNAFMKLSLDEDFKQVGVDTVRLINECTGNNIDIPEGEEKVNMCEGLQGLCNMYASEMLIKNVNTLMKTLNTNLDGACKALQISVQEYEDAKKWLE